jgi:hypothetical protein
MFSVRQKREIAEKIQQILRETEHPELPVGEIQFQIHIAGVAPCGWAVIQNNGAIATPQVNPWNELQDQDNQRDAD